MALDFFPCYHSYLGKIAKLSDQEVGRLFRALLQYSATGEAPELTGRENVAFYFVVDDIDRAREKYEAKCKQNAENVKKRWGDSAHSYTTVYERIRPDTKAKANTKANIPPTLSYESVAPLPGDTTAQKRFSPPSLEDVETYCRERGNSVDAERFVSYYTANGWMVGRNPMKDWKAAVRTWERQSGQKPQALPTEKKPGYNVQHHGDELSELQRAAVARMMEGTE